MLRALFQPDLYHGHNKTHRFFEGWYFKLVDPSRRFVIAVIPGIFMGDTPAETHSFVQVINGTDISYNYELFPATSFRADKKRFALQVGDNAFSGNRMKLRIDSPGLQLAGDLRLSGNIRWPDSLLQPGSMGYYNFLTFMQCYSQVCAMHADLNGSMVINGEHVDFTGGSCYIEKNWGRDFPYAWVWVQSNNFSRAPVSLSCSIAHIPFLTGSFRGFLIGLHLEGSFYKFAT
ncbi:MAG: tocopherol cyclase family protein, partial [Bacillota bacterium]|nr:tocopherol cyclase family protein [Bacillota bacterium]